jgi:hypothetical protein
MNFSMQQERILSLQEHQNLQVYIEKSYYFHGMLRVTKTYLNVLQARPRISNLQAPIVFDSIWGHGSKIPRTAREKVWHIIHPIGVS